MYQNKMYEVESKFVEVPIMLSIVYLGRYLKKRGFWESQ